MLISLEVTDEHLIRLIIEQFDHLNVDGYAPSPYLHVSLFSLSLSLSRCVSLSLFSLALCLSLSLSLSVSVSVCLCLFSSLYWTVYYMRVSHSSMHAPRV